MKTNKKILILLLILLLCTLTFEATVKAAGSGDITDLDYYRPSDTGMNSELKDKAGTVLGIIQTVGSVVSVIALAVIGIKYMLGSVEEKAEYKKTMMPYIIGAIMVFATSNIVSILYNLGKEINDI